ncbi:site-specific integrase [Tenacibaculum sp. XPcli2-G]|uniref:tyrosine-type recombinase/integrase n=1 Tax=Tenacibaculum sp. XPcli2-G TaxID=2954503 RepID=UPI002097B1AE|nr:tyrosine-type recombinase/integrase [Tenacibaculum sp. XPcli2-G]MCO7184275.1 site-specific integrase [Tenacibaculum sp. XPcli2-G]
MMKNFIFFDKEKVPTKVPVISIKKMFSEPKLYIPKIKGTNKPNINKPWHIWYYYRNPFTGAMDKIIEKRGLNRVKTITERKRIGNALKKARLRLLQEGYSPFEEKQEEILDKKSYTISEALELALNEKNKVWAEKTRHGNSSMYNIFVKWVTGKKLANKDIDQLTKRHIIIFLNHISDTSSNTTRNNFKRLISSLLSQLVADDILSYNFVKDIPSLKAKPEKNQPFTIQQLEAIKNYLIKNDKYLYQYMKLVIYALMRPVEICRLKVKDIDLRNNTILFAETKTERANILIIEPLKEVFQKMNLENYNADDFLFTKKEIPGKWNVKKESSKNEFFSRRFKKLKDDIGEEINLNDNHSIYSARHTAAKILFTSFKKQGLTDLQAKHRLMTITRHKSLSGLENYLRDIGASLPDDYTENYSIKF